MYDKDNVVSHHTQVMFGRSCGSMPDLLEQGQSVLWIDRSMHNSNIFIIYHYYQLFISDFIQ